MVEMNSYVALIHLRIGLSRQVSHFIFSITRLINSIKLERSCKILQVLLQDLE